MIQNRRRFLKTAGLAGATFLGASTRSARAQGAAVPSTYFVETSVLRIGYEASGPADGFPIVLLHGFPDDVRAWDGVGGTTRFERGSRFANALEQLDVPARFQSYPGVGHSFVPAMRADAIALFLGS